MPTNKPPSRSSRAPFGILLSGLILAAGLILSSANADATPPPGPRNTSPAEARFFRSLTVPAQALPASPVAYWIAQQTHQIITAVADARNTAGLQCCGVGDCRYVQSEPLPDGSAKVFLGDTFPNSKSRQLIVTPDKYVPNAYVYGYVAQSSVLCASPVGDLSDNPAEIYCFYAAQTLADNPGRMFPLYEDWKMARELTAPKAPAVARADWTPRRHAAASQAAWRDIFTYPLKLHVIDGHPVEAMGGGAPKACVFAIDEPNHPGKPVTGELGPDGGALFKIPGLPPLVLAHPSGNAALTVAVIRKACFDHVDV